MNYSEALDYIHSSHRFGMKLGLESTEKLMELLGILRTSLILSTLQVLMVRVLFVRLSPRFLKKVAIRLGCLHLHILRYSTRELG